MTQWPTAIQSTTEDQNAAEGQQGDVERTTVSESFNMPGSVFSNFHKTQPNDPPLDLLGDDSNSSDEQYAFANASPTSCGQTLRVANMPLKVFNRKKRLKTDFHREGVLTNHFIVGQPRTQPSSTQVRHFVTSLRNVKNIPLFHHHHPQPPQCSQCTPDLAGSVGLLSITMCFVAAGAGEDLTNYRASVYERLRGSSPAARYPHQHSTPSHFKCEHIRGAKGMYPAGHSIAGVLPPASPLPVAHSNNHPIVGRLMTIGLFSIPFHMNSSVLRLFSHPTSTYSAGVFKEHRPVLPSVPAESPEPPTIVNSSGIHSADS
ncbi:hypothetical protein B0H14DRAFT_3131113 [Mycena olivaceomarginata]|nr:hypothetical protein B0H14DRAFT_3131113 [Mycena olivaceomarginata]